jgi:hypothetical protein
LLAAVLRAHPSCRGILFDLPHVIDGARAQVEAQGLGQRMDLVAGSFFEPVIPAAEAYLSPAPAGRWSASLPPRAA